MKTLLFSGEAAVCKGKKNAGYVKRAAAAALLTDVLPDFLAILPR